MAAGQGAGFEKKHTPGQNDEGKVKTPTLKEPQGGVWAGTRPMVAGVSENGGGVSTGMNGRLTTILPSRRARGCGATQRANSCRLLNVLAAE
jgi:hypothetical protein